MAYRLGPASLKEALAEANGEWLRAMMRELPISTPRPTRKADMAKVILRCLDGVRLKELWSRLDDLQQHRFMRATGRDFEVTRDPWRLYLEDPQYWSFGYETTGGGAELETRYLLCFLFEYAATLGLVDIASVPLAAAERLLLETFASVEAEGVWRLDLDRALTAAESGHEPTELRKFLTQRDDQPLPEKVEGFLRTIERGMKALKPAVDALLIECADAEVADRIAGNPHAAKHCLRAGPKSLSVPVKSEKKFRKAVHALGYALPPR